MIRQPPRFDFNVAGIPMEMYRTDRIESVMNNALERGEGAYATLDRMRDEQVRQLRDDADARQRLREIYKQAGVNFFSPTVDEVRLPRWHSWVSSLDWLEKVTEPSDVRDVIEEDKVGVLFNTQNLGELIGDEINDIERFYNEGVRCAQLTYNNQNMLASGCTERGDNGLSKLGIKAVSKMNELGMVVDLSHSGKQTTLDAIKTSEKPVAFTHSGCEELSPHPRCKSDEELHTLAENDGYLGLVMIPSFVASGREDEVVDVYFEQLEYARSILGIDRIGIASDWVTMIPEEVPKRLQEKLEDAYLDRLGWEEEHDPKVAQGFGPISKYRELSQLQEEFRERGYSEEEIDKVLGENFLRFWERALS